MLVRNVFTQISQTYSYLYFSNSLIIPKNGVSSRQKTQLKFTLLVTHPVTPLQVYVDERVFPFCLGKQMLHCAYLHTRTTS
jgi:hypothetical protein